jgi:hypothetical protein
MNRKAQRLTRLAAVVAVLSALALPYAGWGWDSSADNGGSPDDTPVAAQAN